MLTVFVEWLYFGSNSNFYEFYNATKHFSKDFGIIFTISLITLLTEEERWEALTQ